MQNEGQNNLHLLIMALENYGSGKIFLSIADGKLVRTFKEANENTKQRINKNGKVVHEQTFDAITGLLTGVSKRENEYGIFIEISMKDGEDNYQISAQFSGRYSSSFMKALPNVTTAEPVRLLPWSMVDKNDPSKKVTGITLYQNDGNGWVKIAPYYTKEDPKGLPQMVKAKIKGKIVWDDTEMLDFLFAAAQKAFNGAAATSAKTPVASDEPPF